LNRLYKQEPALHELDFYSAGFEWIDCKGSLQSIVCLLRKDRSEKNTLLVVCNFTPVPRLRYSLGVPLGGFWKELLNSDAQVYGGSGTGNMGGLKAFAGPHHGRPFVLNLTLPPLGIIFFKNEENRVRV